MRFLRCLLRPTVVLSPLAPCLLALCLLAGCHGGPQTDIIERELRWQEDQIYALEDYVMEYQAKVRRLREENEMLAGALAQCEQNGNGKSSRRSDTPGRTPVRGKSDRSAAERDEPVGSRSNPPLDSFEDLPTPAPRTRSAPPLELDPPPANPPIDIPEVTIPELPTIESLPVDEIQPDPSDSSPTTWLGPPAPERVAVELPWIVGSEEPVSAAVATNTHEWISELPAASPQRLPAVAMETKALPIPVSWIDGGADPDIESEIQTERETTGDVQSAMYLVDLDDEEHSAAAGLLLAADLTQQADGELLEVTVTPLTSGDEPTDFHGVASMMLRDPAVEGPDGRLARWDFDAEQVAQSWHASARGEVLRFALPLEEPLPSGQPIALWVRLEPEVDDEVESNKILDHLTLRLEDTPLPTGKKSGGKLSGGEWAVALPGQPALLERPQTEVSSAWRSTKAAAY